jgi:GT2 family glycosyltransferase
LAQTYPDKEIIVVNDGSTDDPLGILSEYSVRVIHQKNAGVSAARNAGVKASRGDYAIILDGDDYLDPQYIEKTLPLMEDGVAAVCTDIQYFGDSKALQKTIIPTVKEWKKGNTVACTALFRRQPLLDIRYNTSLFAYEDWNLWLDLVERGWDIAVLNEPLFHYRVKNKVSDSFALQGRMKHEELVQAIRQLHPKLYNEKQVTNIVVLSKFPDIFAKCRESIEKFAPNANKILVRDGDDIIPPAGWTTVEGIKPFCYSRNANLGIQACKNSGDILLCNDDVTFIHDGTLEALQAYMDSNPKVGVLSPKVIGGVANRLQNSLVPEDGLSKYYLAFVCVLLRRSAINKVGLLDERFTTYGGDDVDYCRQMFKAGYQFAVTKTATIRHGHGAYSASSSYQREFGDRQAAMQEESAKVYQDKWGDLLFEWGNPTIRPYGRPPVR